MRTLLLLLVLGQTGLTTKPVVPPGLRSTRSALRPVKTYPFTSNGPLFTDDANTKCHVYWNAAGTLTDTKGCAWVANGSPPALSSSILYPNGFAAASRRGVGPLDDTDNLKLGTGSDVLDITTGTICMVFAITQVSDGTAQQNIYSNHDGARGWRLFIQGSANSRQLCAHWAPSGSTPCGANAPLDAPFLACFGHTGTAGYYALGSSDLWSTVTTVAPQAPTAAIAYLGRGNATAAPGHVKFYEFWVTSTLPSAIDFPTLYGRFRGQLSTAGTSLMLRRTTAGTWNVNGVSQNGTVSELRMNESGAYLDTDWVRAPRGYGIGATKGGMSFVFTPDFASNVASDKVLISDEPWGGNTLATSTIEMRYVAASDKFQVRVGATTVLSAAQSFSSGTAMTLGWRYTANGTACVQVGTTSTCSALTTVSPGAFLSIGGNLHDVYSTGAWRNVGFLASSGALPISIAALGDSITEGHFADTARVTYPERLGASLGAGYQVDNHGVIGDIVTGMDFRYDSYVKGRGYTAVAFMGGINNIMTLNQSGATVYALWAALADEIVADGHHLITSTVLPFKTSASWTAGKQTELDALNTSILAYCAAHPTVSCFDGYSVFEDPANADELLPAYEHTDHLHLSAAGNTALAAQVGAFLP